MSGFGDELAAFMPALTLHWAQRKDGRWNADCPCGATLCGFESHTRLQAETVHLALLAGYGSVRHGSFTTYLPRLKKRGLVADLPDGIALTDAGIAEAGHAVQRGPRGAEEVRDFWRAKLNAGQWKMLEALIDAGPVTRPELAERCGYSNVRHGSFTTYLPVLKRLGLAVESGGKLSAARVLYEGDAAA